MAATEDIPRTGPFIRPTFEQFTGWLSSPDFSARWYFTAKDGDRVIGMSNLRFPPVQGNVLDRLHGRYPSFGFDHNRRVRLS